MKKPESNVGTDAVVVGTGDLLGSVAFGLLWIDSEFVHEGVLMRKTYNGFGKRMSDCLAAAVGGHWPIDVNQQVQATIRSKMKRVVLFLPNAEGETRGK